MRQISYLAAALALAGCKSADKSPADSARAGAAAPSVTAAARPSADSAFHPAWTKSAVIYEVNVRQYTPQGTFAALQPQLPRLKKLGVDILWLMPVQPIGKKNRKGPLGSYYSISDYTAVNPEFGTVADAKAFIDAAHAQGLKVILDWVANHTAFDHEWITAHPDWYTHRKDGSISQPLDQSGKETDWTDVAELDYSKPAMRQAMIGEMKWWVDSLHLDGFRCDVAWGVPVDFWVQARTALKADDPNLFFLAEAEDPALHAAFDATYGWDLHHLLNDIAKGKQGTGALDAYFAKQDSAYGPGAYRLYFTSNHDENSWSGTEFERMGANHKPAFVLAATAEYGMPLLYTGQEASFGKRLKFFEKDTVVWTGPSLAGFYSSVFALKHAEPALANGPWGAPQVKLTTSGDDKTYAFTRTKRANTVLTAVNFGDAPVKLTYQALPQPGDYTDWFSKAKVPLAAAGAIEVPAHGYRVLVR